MILYIAHMILKTERGIQNSSVTIQDMGKSKNRRTFSKIENLRFLQNYDDYNSIFGIKLKDLSLSFNWRVTVKLKCVNYKIFRKKKKERKEKEKPWFLPKNAFSKLENIHNFDTYFQPLRNIVLKLFDDKCKSKACEILTQSYYMDWYSRSCIFFMRQLRPSLKDKM